MLLNLVRSTKFHNFDANLTCVNKFMCFFGILEKFLKKQRGDPLKNFVPHRTDLDLVTSIQSIQYR
jgi:hypothetical protein